MSDDADAPQDRVNPRINFEQFPKRIRFSLTDDARKEYWQSLEEAYEEQHQGERATARRLGKSLGIHPSEASCMRLGRKVQRGGYSEIRIPLSLFEKVKQELGVEYHYLQDFIQDYAAGTYDKIIPELDGERKLPIIFTPELAMALSAARCSQASQNRYVFTLDSKSGQEQIEWLHETFREHYGVIPEPSESARKQRVYPVPAAVMAIGLPFLDGQLYSEDSDLCEQHYMAVLFGLYAAKGNFCCSDGSYISSKKEAVLKSASKALSKCSIEHYGVECSGYSRIIVPQREMRKLYQQALDCTETMPGAEKLLGRTMKTWKSRAERSRRD